MSDHDDRLRALETRLILLENHVKTLRNELVSSRNSATHADTNAALVKVAHLGIGH
ncbi:hypothetical protein [Sphaerimonospora mesophila]|uniref:hypothetical protein n=1 Tax=Sphaerimonospora mesophila TaxID=37483 RepID=UPI000AFA7E2E